MWSNECSGVCVCGAMRAVVCVCVWSNEGSDVCGAMRAVVGVCGAMSAVVYVEQ